MSLRVQLFKTLIQSPLTARDLTIYIPALKFATLVVQSSTLPAEQWKSFKVQLRGQEIELPSVMQVQGDWTFTVADATHTLLRARLMHMLYGCKTFNVYLFPGLKLNLNTGDWNTIATLGQEFLSIMHSSLVLEDCWIRNIAPAQFDESRPETPITWTVTVHYNLVSTALAFR